MQLEARLVRLRYWADCFVCNKELERGTYAWWHYHGRFVVCSACNDGDAAPLTPPRDLVSPLGWAQDWPKRAEKVLRQQEEARRHDHEQSGLSAAIWQLCSSRIAARVWDPRAVAEQMVGAMLDPLVEDAIVVLHDVALDAERSNLDHVVVGPSGIYVIDSVLCMDDRIEIGPRADGNDQLFVGSRNATPLVDEMRSHVRTIEQLVADVPRAANASVAPMVCFVRGDWGWPRRQEAIAGVHVLWPSALVRIVSRPGPLHRTEIEELGGRLAMRLAHA